ncbi:MAG: FG-GAP repeat protein [Ardenticatenales bacterium]|nr:FG-GAP repeat protein [Ardenticatenales bacterium]
MVMSFFRASRLGSGLALLMLLYALLTPHASAENPLSSLPPQADHTSEELSPQAWALIWQQLREGEALPPQAPYLQTENLRKIFPGDGASADNFGWSMALSGDTLVIGAPGDEPSGLDPDAGSVYIFERNQGGTNRWGQVKKLFASDANTGALFGYSLALSADTLVVGAPKDDAPAVDSGSAYVFERNGGGENNWGETKKLVASDGAFDDQFGRDVAVSNSTIVVGAWLDGDEGTNFGSAYIYERDEGGAANWGEATRITPADASIGDHFGWIVGISLNTIVVSAIGDDDGGNSSGAIYLFDRSGEDRNSWVEVKKLRASDKAAGDQFGYSVDISSDTIVVGAVGDDDKGINAGAVYFFGRHEGGANAWGQIIKRTAFDGAADNVFGGSVALSRDTVIVGSPASESSAGQVNSGAAYLFERNLGGLNNWGQMDKLTAPDEFSDDTFGYSVMVDIDTVVIGAHNNDDRGTDSGSAYVAELTRLWSYYLPCARQ